MLWGPVRPLAADSPSAGAPNGVHLAVGPGGPVRARLLLGGGSLPPGDYPLHLRLEEAAGGGPFHVSITGAGVGSGAGADIDIDGGAGAPGVLEARIAHGGGPLALEAALRAPAPRSVWVGEARVTTLR